jgi:hypothetical protein
VRWLHASSLVETDRNAKARGRQLQRLIGATREKNAIHRHYLLLCLVPTPPWFSFIRAFTILLIKA